MIKRTSTKLKIQLQGGRQQTFIGREARALHHLVNASRVGVTTPTQPAPCWSHYIYKLRGVGPTISTDYEAYSEDFPANYGRYRLETAIKVFEGGRQ